MKVALKSLSDRSIEWFAACVMLAWGVTFSLPGDLLSQPAFVAFNRYGTTDSFWVFAFTGMGATRLIALYINGRWPRSPHIRIVGALFGAISWAQIAYLFLEAAQINQTPVGTGPAVYALLGVFELISIHRAAFDARYHNS